MVTMTTPAFDALLRAYGGFEGIDLTIDPHDEMLAHTVESEAGDVDRARLRYFVEGWRTCLSMVDVARWRFGDLSRVSLLDFASGFGRVTRHTIRSFPRKNVTVSDIVEDAVVFQRTQFGVRGFVSAARAEDLDIPERYDLVFVTSLFSHLPAEAFRSWLRRLFEATSDKGVLAISVHDRALFGRAGEDLDSPSLFVPVSESKVLDGEQYGTMWVSEGFVRQMVREVAPSASCHRIPRGLGNFQDLYLIVREQGADFSGFVYDCGPVGFIDKARFEDGKLWCHGWAEERSPDARVTRVEVWLRGERTALQDSFLPRPDVAAFLGDDRKLHCGFEFRLEPPDDISFTEVVLIVAVSTLERRTVLYAGSIDGLLHVSTKNDLETMWQSESAEERLREESELVRALEARVGILEQTISAMEASRFWKIRNIWFGFKRRLGLVRDEDSPD